MSLYDVNDMESRSDILYDSPCDLDDCDDDDSSDDVDDIDLVSIRGMDDVHRD